MNDSASPDGARRASPWFPGLRYALLYLAASLPLRAAGEPVGLTLSTSLPIAAGHEPALATDADDATFFLSARPPRDGDDFLLTWAAPVHVKSVAVLSGAPDGRGKIEFACVETAEEAGRFTAQAALREGVAQIGALPAPVRALRIRFTGAGAAEAALRTVAVATEEVVAPTRFATRIESDWSNAPKCERFARRAQALVEEWYPKVRARLASTPEPPPTSVLRLIYAPISGVAYTTGDTIRISEDWVVHKAPRDFGMVIHEMTHVIQAYKGGGEGWATEGIADYIRDFVFEPGARRIEFDPGKASYTDGYTTSAAFLDWLERGKAPGIVAKINAASRAGQSVTEAIKASAGAEPAVLWREFVAARTAEK